MFFVEDFRLDTVQNCTNPRASVMVQCLFVEVDPKVDQSSSRFYIGKYEPMPSVFVAVSQH